MVALLIISILFGLVQAIHLLLDLSSHILYKRVSHFILSILALTWLILIAYYGFDLTNFIRHSLREYLYAGKTNDTISGLIVVLMSVFPTYILNELENKRKMNI